MATSSKSKSKSKNVSKSKKGNTVRKNTSNKKYQHDFQDFHGEIALLISIAVAILIVLSNFSIAGIVGDAVSGILFGIFGIVQYVMPVALFFAVALLISNKFSSRSIKKVIFGFAFLMLISAFCQLIVDIHLTGINGLYDFAKNNKYGGGVIGGSISAFLFKYFGAIGAYVIVIVLSIVFTVLIFEKSFIKAIKNGTNKITKNLTNSESDEEEEEIQESRQINISKIPNKKAKKDLLSSMTVLPSDNEKGIIKNSPKQKSRSLDIKDDVHEITMEYNLPDDIENFPKQNVEMTEVVDNKETKSTKKRKKIRNKLVEPVDENLPFALKEEAKAVDTLVENAKEDISNQSISIHKEENNPASSSEQLSFNDEIKNEGYSFPPYSLLAKGNKAESNSNEESVRATAMKLQQTLDNFGVKVTMTDVSCGPSVTRYEMQPEMGVKVSKILSLSDDIKLNLAAADIRIEAPIPGKAAIGIEVPNKENATVLFRDLIENDDFRKFPSDVAFAVGKDIAGKIVIADIAKMPHLLIAGQTGSGKSVCINTLIMSILYKANPEDVKLIMIDPKVVELSVYNGIPHLLIPVVTDAKKASSALAWAVNEMTNRYKLFAEVNVRNLKGYNKKVEETINAGEGFENELKKLPQIVIIVDELADLMMVAPGEVEDAIVRLSQLARAAGIHLVIATQRPSVNVITGLIKANVPSRIAFAVSQGVDSRTIIDMNGAEKLLGKGDMLFYPSGYQKPVRVQGAFVSDKEVSDIVDFLSVHNEKKKETDNEIEKKISESAITSSSATTSDRDEYFIEAGKFIIDKDRASIGMLQRMYKIGFNRAARIMDQLADAGVVGPEEGTKPRKVIMSMEEFEQYIEEYV